MFFKRIHFHCSYFWIVCAMLWPFVLVLSHFGYPGHMADNLVDNKIIGNVGCKKPHCEIIAFSVIYADGPSSQFTTVLRYLFFFDFLKRNLISIIPIIIGYFEHHNFGGVHVIQTLLCSWSTGVECKKYGI